MYVSLFSKCTPLSGPVYMTLNALYAHTSYSSRLWKQASFPGKGGLRFIITALQGKNTLFSQFSSRANTSLNNGGTFSSSWIYKFHRPQSLFYKVNACKHCANVNLHCFIKSHLWGGLYVCLEIKSPTVYGSSININHTAFLSQCYMGL